MTRKWNNLSKRGLALFLALVMCLGMLPAAAFAAGEETAVCPTCEGVGTIEGTCPDCEGTGKVSVTSECPDCEEPPVCEVCDGKGEVAGEVTVDCDICGGTGEVADPETEELADCEACEGTGKTTEEGLVSCEACADWEEPETCATCGGSRKVTTTEDCAACEGTGKVDTPCGNCGGTGEVTKTVEPEKKPKKNAPVYATPDELDAAFAAVGEVLESSDIQAGIDALDAYIAVYNRLSPENQEANAEALASAQAYRETLVAALEADEEDEEFNDPEINTLNWFESNTNAYHITDSPLSDDVQNQIDASSGKFILYVQTNELIFNQPLTIPSGKVVEVYDYDTYRTIKRGGDYPLFIVKAGGGLTIGGRKLTLDGGGSETQNSLLVVEEGGTLTLKDDLQVKNGKTTLDGGGVYVHDGGRLTIQDNVRFSDCSAAKGRNVYVESGAYFANSANIGDVFDGNNGSSTLEEFYNKPVYVTVNKNAYEGLPGEPSVASGDYLWLKNPNNTDSDPLQNWDYDYTVNRSPGTILKEEILGSPYYIKSTSDSTYGVADPTGKNTKGFVKDDDIWDRFLNVLVASSWANIKVLDTNDKPIALTSSNKDQYEVVPYVIKYQHGFSEGWHIDCAVVPKERIQVDYKLNLPNGMSTTKKFGVPTGSVSFGTVCVFVEALTYGENGENQVTTKSDPIEAKYNNKDVQLKFLGWNTSPDGSGTSYQLGGRNEFSQTTTLYAQWEWEGKTYKVTFDVNEGNGSNTDVTVTEGETVGSKMPTDPTKNQAIFAGWNTKQDGSGTAFTKDTVVNADITVYAQWKDDKLVDPTVPEEDRPTTGGDGIDDDYQREVTYKVAHGSWNDETTDAKTEVVTLREGGELSLEGTATLNAPAVGSKPADGFKEGYDAKNWSPAIPEEFNKDSVKEYTYTYAGDSKVTYPEYKEEDDKPVAPEDKTDEVNKDTVIIVDPDGGTWNHDKGDEYWVPETENNTYKHEVAEGETVSLTPDPTREGYVFVGWKKDGPEEVDGTTTITYTARWAEDKKYDKDDPTKEGSDGIPDVWQAKVTLSIQGGTWNASTEWKNDANNTRIQVYNLYTQGADGKWSKVDNVTVGTLPTGNASAGFTGSGSWNDSTLSATTPVVDGASYTLSFSPVGTTTYYLRYDANDGSGAPGTQSVTAPTGSPHTTTVSTTRPSRSGYTFQGWNTAANGSGTAYGAGDSITLAGNVILYAQWSYNGSTSGGGTGGGGGGGYRPSGGGGTTGGSTVDIGDEDVPLAGGSELNREDHFAYVSGYEDGTVRPTNNITREEVAAIFYRLLTETSRTIYETDVNDFSDVNSGRWSNRAISTLTNAGIISGYEDGSFRPGQSITRAEFATIAAQFEVVTEDVENPFSDTAGHWAETLISFAASKGWVGGYTDGTFKPQKAITRAEAMTLVNNVLEREVDEEGLLADAKQWPDNKKDAWYYYEVLEATNSHDYTRRGSGTVENWTAITND